MNKHKRRGFTVIELVVVIVVIAIIVSVTAVAYRSSQRDARNKKRQSDALMLMAALDEYYADKGTYPKPGPTQCNTTPPYQVNECYLNEIWIDLKNEGYLNTIPTPGTPSHDTTYDKAGNGNANYGYVFGGAHNRYGLLVPREPAGSTGETCKTGRNIVAGWWSSRPECTF